MAEEADMNTRSTRKLVREGDLVAEVEVSLLEADAAGRPICPWMTRTSLMTCGALSERVTSSEPLSSPPVFIV